MCASPSGQTVRLCIREQKGVGLNQIQSVPCLGHSTLLILSLVSCKWEPGGKLGTRHSPGSGRGSIVLSSGGSLICSLSTGTCVCAQFKKNTLHVYEGRAGACHSNL